MQLNTYLQLSGRTASGSYHIDQIPADLVHAIIGINTETIEAVQANIDQDKVHVLEECGDVMWYIALGLRTLGITDMRSILTANGIEEARASYGPMHVDGLILWANVHDAGTMMDLLKKWTFYGKAADAGMLLDLITRIIHRIMIICERQDTLIEAICHANIEKLKARFPNQFTEDLAVNRDVSGERKVLEAAL